MTTIDECKPGDHLVLMLPCVVEITAIEDQQGDWGKGNRKVSYENPQVIAGGPGFTDIGSKVDVSLWENDDET